MAAGVLITFVVVFALVLCAVSVGMKFFEQKRKARVEGMLSTASGERNASISTLLKEVESDKPGGWQGLLARLQFSRKAQTQISEAGMSWTPGRLMTAMGVMALPGLVAGVLFPILLNGFITALIFGACCGYLPYLYVSAKRKKRIARMEDQFPDALDFLARSMRAGHAFSASLEMLGGELEDPLGQEVRALFNEQNLGAPIDVALRNFAIRVPLLDARFFTTSVLLQKQTGGNLSEILTRLAYIIRERFRLRGQVKAASSHGRFTATILSLLPVATGICLAVVAPAYMKVLTDDPNGKKLICAAIVAQLMGKFVIGKIVGIKV
ncbi:MAG TPA: type II secretion system F family protein [Bryobacteraceae bacterium]|nr:type II secretion system F family protein [Bryobacteraceae bacterium]